MAAPKTRLVESTKTSKGTSVQSDIETDVETDAETDVETNDEKIDIKENLEAELQAVLGQPKSKGEKMTNSEERTSDLNSNLSQPAGSKYVAFSAKENQLPLDVFHKKREKVFQLLKNRSQKSGQNRPSNDNTALQNTNQDISPDPKLSTSKIKPEKVSEDDILLIEEILKKNQGNIKITHSAKKLIT